MIKILIVDDQVLFAESLKLVLENEDESFSVMDPAETGEKALKIMSKKLPDVVLLDIQMPGMGGVKTVAEIKKHYPNVHVIMLTTFEDQDFVEQALKNGAVGYLIKNISPDILVSAIRAVQSGSVTLSSGLMGNLIEALSKTDQKINKHIDNDLPSWYKELKPKQKHILKLILDGYTNKEIAMEINVAEQTLRNYVSSIYDILEVDNRRDAYRKTAGIPSFYFD